MAPRGQMDQSMKQAKGSNRSGESASDARRPTINTFPWSSGSCSSSVLRENKQRTSETDKLEASVPPLGMLINKSTEPKVSLGVIRTRSSRFTSKQRLDVIVCYSDSPELLASYHTQKCRIRWLSNVI